MTDDHATPAPPSTPALGDTVRSGAGWVVPVRFGGRLIRVLTFFVLAKVLGPGPLGAVGLIYVIDGIAGIATNLGLMTALVQKKDIGPRHLNSALFVQFCSSVLFAGAIALSAEPLAALFDNQLLSGVLVVYVGVFVIRSVSYAPEALLRREMRFRTFVLIGESANVIGCALMIGLALAGVGVWSVVWAELLRAVLHSALCLVAVRHRFRPWPHMAALREMAAFSGWITLDAVFYYGLCNIDYLVVGHVLGPEALGWYLFAFRLISQPMEHVSTRLQEVIFPAFSRFRDKPEEVLRVYRKLMCAVSLIALPLLSLAALLAPEFFNAVMGPSWRPAIAPFQLLCLTGVMWAFVGSSSAVIKSRGHVQFGAAVHAALFGLMFAGVWFGSAHGLAGVAVAVDAVMVAYLLGLLYYQERKTGVGLKEFVVAVTPAALGAGVAVLAAGGVDLVLLTSTGLGDLARLLISGAAGALAFGLMVGFLQHTLLRSVRYELKQVLRRAFGGA